MEDELGTRFCFFLVWYFLFVSFHGLCVFIPKVLSLRFFLVFSRVVCFSGDFPCV